MSGRLALARGVLWIGRHSGTVYLRPYDLDGRALSPGFAFRDVETGASSVAGLAVDADRGLWLADGRAQRVRRFSLFGGTSRVLVGSEGDARGAFDELADLAVVQDDEGEHAPRLLLACRGWRRHGLQVLDEHGAWLDSLRCEGDPRQAFRGIGAVSARGRWIAAAESGRGRVQIFRDGEFHFLARPPGTEDGAAQISAVALLDDGRWVVGISGGSRRSAVLLMDRAGRPIRCLAEAGLDDGGVFDPQAVVVEAGREDHCTRVAILDRDADRVQVFGLDGRCFGALVDLPGTQA
jgi:hypothetical protein